MHWALVATKNGNRSGMRAGLFATFFLGLTFLTVQINEYVHLGWPPPTTPRVRSSTASRGSMARTSPSA